MQTNLHEQLNNSLKEIRNISNLFLNTGSRLSQFKHRGDPCADCRRPTANQCAYLELTKDGDGPDLCWGDCELEVVNERS